MSRHIKANRLLAARSPPALSRADDAALLAVAGMFALSIPVSFVTEWAFAFWVARRSPPGPPGGACRPTRSNVAVKGVHRDPASEYLDNSGRDDELSGGSRLIPIDTPAGKFRVWVKRTGNNPRLKVLLLHGGPGATHEYLEACDSFLPAAGIEYYYYDQLGSGFSDQPAEPSLWDVDRFVEEVEQVREALGLGPDNFVLYGHSWGGILAIEYALKYQRHLRWPGDLQHDVQRAGLQRLRRAGPDARDGPAGARGDQGAGGGGPDRGSALHGAADRAALRPSRTAHAARGLAGPGEPRLRPHQSRDLRVHARVRASSASAATRAWPAGTGPRSSAPSPCRRWSSAPSTTPWIRRTWR